ncbi:serine hydrolase [Massilia sp. DJPM01]|uniref:serine hydrolase n=1 Tax=Massilia sp. DJPM01 TaxID=3024404 RepID=UPI00259E5C99|nr:serine hydrolase [Massilia sp. DJPM01]MDM5177133.1 serine hydrolase [Massilia sp. DJPM01]
MAHAMAPGAMPPLSVDRQRAKPACAVGGVRNDRSGRRARRSREQSVKQAHARRPARAILAAALRSNAVLILDPVSRETLFEKNSAAVMPIASLTKLMTALVVVEARQDMEQLLTVTDADVDRLKYSSSRLKVGTRLSRSAMLHIALMSSENRAASALGRSFPGGVLHFVAAMNARAQALGMTSSRFFEPTGLSSANVSSPEDLAKLVLAAHKHALIRRYSTDPGHTIAQGSRRTPYRNSNRLIANARWHIGLQKTGYIAEAGRCMVLHANLKGRPVVMVFLDAQGKFSRAADANRVRSWLGSGRRSARP